MAPDCAPSLYPDRAGLIWNLRDMLGHGYVVVATDYPGLGTEGVHPYLIGESAGRAVLDSVRATQQFKNSGASNRFAVWGHSEGGHAALFTGQLAARYRRAQARRRRGARPPPIWWTCSKTTRRPSRT
ncbi:hypothetical protein AUC69_10710 [Methyloceanibacter superfactus]|uniref:Serine aminopeptidase S33 domain-containing protein n=1 Tax=Methyloceanibacter superfactus TaxID=1774969 RepID=A0A1E3VXR8_9HYPH|nr:lipase family protein [Methyloceanibacter superfactus]ODR98337.1 hypothetical protein AUC69_10710 [Methyloceanibacter superfactus]